MVLGNTLNIELAKELYKATNMVSTNNNIKVLILTGKGKLFCGGGDLKFLLSNEDKIKETLLEMTHYFHGAIARMTRMEAPVIIGINGTAGGGGPPEDVAIHRRARGLGLGQPSARDLGFETPGVGRCTGDHATAQIQKNTQNNQASLSYIEQFIRFVAQGSFQHLQQIANIFKKSLTSTKQGC